MRKTIFLIVYFFSVGFGSESVYGFSLSDLNLGTKQLGNSNASRKMSLSDLKKDQDIVVRISANLNSVEEGESFKVFINATNPIDRPDFSDLVVDGGEVQRISKLSESAYVANILALDEAKKVLVQIEAEQLSGRYGINSRASNEIVVKVLEDEDKGEEILGSEEEAVSDFGSILNSILKSNSTAKTVDNKTVDNRTAQTNSGSKSDEKPKDNSWMSSIAQMVSGLFGKGGGGGSSGGGGSEGGKGAGGGNGGGGGGGGETVGADTSGTDKTTKDKSATAAETKTPSIAAPDSPPSETGGTEQVAQAEQLRIDQERYGDLKSSLDTYKQQADGGWLGNFPDGKGGFKPDRLTNEEYQGFRQELAELKMKLGIVGPDGVGTTDLKSGAVEVEVYELLMKCDPAKGYWEKTTDEERIVSYKGKNAKGGTEEKTFVVSKGSQSGKELPMNKDSFLADPKKLQKNDTEKGVIYSKGMYDKLETKIPCESKFIEYKVKPTERAVGPIDFVDPNN